MLNSTPIEISEKNLKDLDRILSTVNVHINSLKRSHVLRRIRARMLRCGYNNFENYLSYVRKSEDEIEEIKLTFSINVTHFFRNYDTFEYLQKNILPIIKKQSQGKEIKIWSAGCADGAEPYTLAIICERSNIRRYRIIASDYNPDLIKLAKKGIYSRNYLKETPQDIQLKYFKNSSSSNDQVEINSELRENIEFRLFNLISDRIEKIKIHFDLVLCRNVLIYFTRSEQLLIYEKFYQRTKTNGFFVVGRSEILPMTWRDRFSIESPYHRVSRKI
ncbi:MAG: CheR family methyltransferase [Candidatus Hodarchaeales archaeon]